MDPVQPGQSITEAESESLTHRTARGFAWMAGQSVATKALGTVGQIIIAWFLLPDDFGLAAIAYSFSVLPSLIQQGGLKEVLIQRHHEFQRWASPAFWMSLTLGTIGGLVMLGIAPLAANWYGQPKLLGLLMIIAVMFPLDSLITVPLARVHTQMRFRFAATLMLGQTGLQTALTIVFAASGFGAFSLLLPRPIIGVITTIICWIAAPVRVSRSPQIREWRNLIGDGALVIGANACDLLILYGSYFILSVVASPDVVGLYYFAFNLSIQSLVLVTSSLQGVLFPALSTLRDQQHRQREAFLRAVRLLACIAIPACWLQAAGADSAIRIFFPERWHEAIPLVQLLSGAMALKAIGRPALSMMQAQGRFGAQLIVAIISLTLYLALLAIGATQGGALGVAIAVTVHLAVIEPLNLLVALGLTRRSAADAFGALGRPVLFALMVVGTSWLASLAIPRSVALSHWLRIAVLLAVAITLYFHLFPLLVPDSWREARTRVAAFINLRRSLKSNTVLS